MAITAALVKELRERTGAGMMDCKRALVETGGDLEAAIEVLRIQGQAKADRKATRVAAEGLIGLAVGDRAGALVEVNCETDFVARKEEFRAFADGLAALVLAEAPDGLETLGTLSLEGETVEVRRRELVAAFGENVDIRRFTRLEAAPAGRLGAYSHGGRIGVVVSLEGGDEQVAKDVAMHIAASRPLAVGESDLPDETVAKEREILRAQAAESGKEPAIVERMVAGRLRKYLAEVTLLGQSFIKDPDRSVGDYLEGKGAKVHRFVRFEVGEGIDKKADNFAEEVMAQARGS